MADGTPVNLFFRGLESPADVTVLEEIIRRTGVFHPEEIPVARELLDDCLVQGGSGYYRCFLAQDRAGILGYALFVEVAGTIGTFELYWLAVDPSFQGTGVGHQLMAELERQVRNAAGQRIYISTSAKPEYRPARQLYLSCGYELAGRLPNYFRQGDDLLYYHKTLEAGPCISR
ncbi:MAG: N-acetyltransferase [Clostridia bacterium]|nr:N-acetyltransferase [Clostridia bacterium]